MISHRSGNSRTFAPNSLAASNVERVSADSSGAYSVLTPSAISAAAMPRIVWDLDPVTAIEPRMREGFTRSFISDHLCLQNFNYAGLPERGLLHDNGGVVAAGGIIGSTCSS